GGKLPAAIINPPGLKGGMINLPCILILFVILLFLIRGMTQTAKLNDILVVIKLSVVILFIVVGAAHIKPVNWHPFFPYGVSGVFKGAAIVFFAYIGFDAVSS
ncbi:MAG TPA: amino acid permease, partial [Clostridium sp.]|nr:amino acid permease [Clostridium sp.]